MQIVTGNCLDDLPSYGQLDVLLKWNSSHAKRSRKINNIWKEECKQHCAETNPSLFLQRFVYVWFKGRSFLLTGTEMKWLALRARPFVQGETQLPKLDTFVSHLSVPSISKIDESCSGSDFSFLELSVH